MTVKQCDRCGKIIPNKCADETSVVTYEVSKEGYLYSPRDFDLCHDCTRAFVKWIRELGNVN